MNNKVNSLTQDIIDSINSIDEHLQFQRDFNLYLNNKTMRRSVERELEIIGEAIKKLLVLKPELKISSAPKIISLRNFIIHAYDSIDDNMIWAIIINHLPILKTEIEELILKLKD